MGVIRASQNDATFRRDGKAIYIDGDELLNSAEPFFGFQSLNLECLPNRDSLVYGEKYGIESAQNIFRGSECYAVPLHLQCCVSFSDTCYYAILCTFAISIPFLCVRYYSASLPRLFFVAPCLQEYGHPR